MENHKYTSTLQRLGLIIKQIRVDTNVTQQLLASMCDIDVRTIQRIEKGEQNMTLGILFSIADSLNVKPDELIKSSFEVE